MTSSALMIGLVYSLTTSVLSLPSCPQQAISDPVDRVYFASGIKTGEVTQSSAIVWVRLTRNPQAVSASAPMFEVKRRNVEKIPDTAHQFDIVFPDNSSLETVRFAVPGRAGFLKIHYRKPDVATWQQTQWLEATESSDYTVQHRLGDLEPGCKYELKVEARAELSGESSTIEGRFNTAHRPNQPASVGFAVSTGQMFNDRDGDQGFDIYPQMLRLKPDFFVHTGDIVYYDKLAKDAPLARYHWQRTYGLKTNIEFHRTVPSYFIKDDHDTLVDDCWPVMKAPRMGEMTFRQGQQIFRQQVPMGKSTYRTVRWGRDLQIWMVEGRDFRSPNPMADGPQKSIWGGEQKQWFKTSVAASDATFKILISPTPLVGPDRKNKADNHSNQAFAHEGNELRSFVASQKDMFVVCGDRHWQYFSIDPRTQTREYSCGPASEKHAGGWKQSDYRKDYHRFLRVGGGFLHVTVRGEAETASIAFRFIDTAGKVHFEDVHTVDLVP